MIAPTSLVPPLTALIAPTSLVPLLTTLLLSLPPLPSIAGSSIDDCPNIAGSSIDSSHCSNIAGSSIDSSPALTTSSAAVGKNSIDSSNTVVAIVDSSIPTAASTCTKDSTIPSVPNASTNSKVADPETLSAVVAVPLSEVLSSKLLEDDIYTPRKAFEGYLKAEVDALRLQVQQLKISMMTLLQDNKVLKQKIQSLEGTPSPVTNKINELERHLSEHKEATKSWASLFQKEDGNAAPMSTVISATISEEKLRDFKSLNVRVRGVLDTQDAMKEAKSFLDTTLSFNAAGLDKAWRTKKDNSTLIIRFISREGLSGVGAARVLVHFTHATYFVIFPLIAHNIPRHLSLL
ncbi:hypothetical protein O6H91_03G029800 [Diphasiastrum complanatum]|uniref:Uncharacterized protein n=1 Tax=Diphasiastrum complanatum TaxID=34168 RepID=A0ACC2E4V0_DIPCM|nr:hypothetical protein O6H91_Y341300 [Diphasiastrum complanatum]KAJ7561469.1 hypothetical protein O6H91_03G029800 [Diphasiastrum complanatum]